MSARNKILSNIPRAKVIAFSFDTDSADGYLASPTDVTVTMPFAGTYLCTLPDTYEEFYFVGCSLSDGQGSSTARALVSSYSATAGTITIKTQSAAGTDAVVASGIVTVCVIAGRDD